MTEREHARALPDLEVFDVDGEKAGTVAHVYEDAPGTADSAANTGISVGSAGGISRVSGSGVIGSGFMELKTGLLGLGRRYFIPLSAVTDVTDGGVFLNCPRGEFDDLGWHTRPTMVSDQQQNIPELSPDRPHEVVRPTSVAVSAARLDAPAEPMNMSAPGLNWTAVSEHYRTRWTDHYRAGGAQWETYEARYRFAWEMAGRPEYQHRSWISVQSELRNYWELLYPDQEWDTVSDAIKDAWEHQPPDAGMADRPDAIAEGMSAPERNR